jgi:hypothetical protein
MTAIPPDSENPTELQAPSSYMRARRPHLFSDSTKKTDVLLSKEVLSHHLETLTKQKSETVFEGFAKRLVEKFVAPNLRPQLVRLAAGMERPTPKPTQSPKKFRNDGSRRIRPQQANAGLSHSAQRKIGAARFAPTSKKLRAPAAATPVFTSSQISTRLQDRVPRSKILLRRNSAYPSQFWIELGCSIVCSNAIVSQSLSKLLV